MPQNLPATEPVKTPSIFETLTNIAANRNWLSSLVGALGLFVLIGSLTPEQAQQIVASAQKMMDGFGMIVGGSKEIFIILWPVIQGIISRSAGNSSTLPSILSWLGQDKNKSQGIVVVAPPAIANSTTATNVIASTDATVVAKPDVTASLPMSAPVVSTELAKASPHILQK